MPVDIGTLGVIATLIVGFAGIIFTIYLAFRQAKDFTKALSDMAERVADKLSDTQRSVAKIEVSVQSIPTIGTQLAQIDERTSTLLKFLPPPPHQTVTLSLTNIGRVTVSAEPFPGQTQYTLQFLDKGIKAGLIGTVAVETGFQTKERQMLGANAVMQAINPQFLIVSVPSTNPQVCAGYISEFLRWLDSEYWSAVEKVIGRYENIEVLAGPSTASSAASP